MANTVKVEITAEDKTGGAFASAISREKALAAISDATSQKELAAAGRSERALRTRENAFSQVARAAHFMDQEMKKALQTQEKLDQALGSGGGWLSRLLHRGGGPSGLWGLAGAGGQGGAGMGAAGPAGIGALIAAAAAMAPSLIPFGIGGMVAGGGAAGGLIAANKIQADLFSQRTLLNQIRALQEPAKPLTEAQHRTLALDLAKYRSGSSVGQLQHMYGPLSHYQNAFQGLGSTALTTGVKALTSGGSGSFLSGMGGILKQIGGFIKSIGPQLGQLFRASLPFASAFVKIMEQFGRAVLPVVTQMLKQMTPYLPILMQGFKLLVQGIAGFLKNLGPGMKDSAIIFKASMEVVKGLLQLVGAAVSFFANVIVKTAEVIRAFARDIPRWFDAARAFLSHFFTVDIPNWINDALKFFQQLPGKTLSALSKLPSMLFQAGKNAIQYLINGMGSMLGSLGSMASSIASKVAGFFGLSPAKEGPLSGGGAPEIRGRHFADALAAGMRAGLPGAGSAAGALAGALAGGAAHGHPGGTGGGTVRIQLEWAPGSGSDPLLTWIRNQVRLKGGGNVQTAFGRN